MSYIFISYSRHDKPYVQRLAGALEQRGLGVWWDDALDAAVRREGTSASAQGDLSEGLWQISVEALDELLCGALAEGDDLFGVLQE